MNWPVFIGYVDVPVAFLLIFRSTYLTQDVLLDIPAPGFGAGSEIQRNCVRGCSVRHMNR